MAQPIDLVLRRVGYVQTVAAPNAKPPMTDLSDSDRMRRLPGVIQYSQNIRWGVERCHWVYSDARA